MDVRRYRAWRIHGHLSSLETGRSEVTKAGGHGACSDKGLGGGVTSSGKLGRKKRKMSAAARAKIGKATKARWAKFRAAKAKGKH